MPDRSFIIWVAIEVVIIYLAIVVFVAAQVLIRTNDLPHLVTASDHLDINTGDILGVGYKHPFAWFVTAWSTSKWTHTGVAWRDPVTNELFVMEAAYYDKRYSGVFRIPFDLWVRINKNSHMCHLKYRGPPIDAAKMDTTFKEMEKIKLDSFNWTWYRLLLKRPYKEESLDRHFVCYEITVLLLQRMGIIAKKYNCSSYFARDIIWGKVDMEPGCSYDQPVTLDYRFPY